MSIPVIPAVVERRYVPKLPLKQLTLSAFSALMQTLIEASTVLDSMLPSGAQPWAPNPDTATLQAAKDAYDLALAAWNPEGPRGSHADRVALAARRLEAEQVFMKYADYVSSWSRFDGELIPAAGLQTKSAKSPQGSTGTATGLQQILVVRSGGTWIPVRGGFVGLSFKKAPNARAYNIYAVDNSGIRTKIASQTKTRNVKLGGSYPPGHQVTVVVEAIGTKGCGSISEPITLTAF